ADRVPGCGRAQAQARRAEGHRAARLDPGRGLRARLRDRRRGPRARDRGEDFLGAFPALRARGPDARGARPWRATRGRRRPPALSGERRIGIGRARGPLRGPALALLALALPACATAPHAESDWEKRNLQGKPAGEDVALPAYPQPKNLVQFRVPDTEGFRYFVDRTTLRVDANDSLVRYVLVARSSEGAQN